MLSPILLTHDSLILVGPGFRFLRGSYQERRGAWHGNQQTQLKGNYQAPSSYPTRGSYKTQSNYQSRGNSSYRSRGKANNTQHNQGGFRSVSSAKKTITVTRPGHRSDRTACVHTRWWQTSPICSRLALSDKGPVDAKDCSRLRTCYPRIAGLNATYVHSSTHAIEGEPVTSFKGRGTYVQSLIEKEAVAPVDQSRAYPTSPFLVVPKSRG